MQASTSQNVLHVHTSNKTKRELNQSYFEHVLLAWMMQKAKSPPVPTAPKTALLVFPTPSAEVSYFSEFEKNKCVNRRKHWLAFVGLFSYSAENKRIESKKIFFTYFVDKLLPFSDQKQTYCGWSFLLLFPWIKLLYLHTLFLLLNKKEEKYTLMCKTWVFEFSCQKISWIVSECLILSFSSLEFPDKRQSVRQICLDTFHDCETMAIGIII